MRNIKLIIEYDGTNYAGWQIQNSCKPQAASCESKTIQEIIEKTIQRILQEKIKIIGSGRTDSGVHAFAQAANFKTISGLPISKIQKALNSLLPSDISIKEIGEADKDFHSRYSAKSKTYRYFILNSEIKSAFLNKHVWHIPYQLNVLLMRKEARALLGRHDFKSFRASGSSAKTTVRTVKKLSIKTLSYKLSPPKAGPPTAETINHSRQSRDPDLWLWLYGKPNHCLTGLSGKLIIIDIQADGFLYNMVRNIVGTLVEIGRGRFLEGSLKKILLAKNREQAGPTAPAQGLFLVEVKY